MSPNTERLYRETIAGAGLSRYAEEPWLDGGRVAWRPSPTRSADPAVLAPFVSLDSAYKFGKEASTLAQQAAMLNSLDKSMSAIDKAEAGGKIDADKAKQMVVVLNGTDKGMPPWKQLSDVELAAVATYVKNSWGNSAGAAVQVKRSSRRRHSARSRRAARSSAPPSARQSPEPTPS